MKNNILLGSDPEIFVENDLEIVTAEGLIEGTKWEPYPISEDGHCIQIDNIAMEFNIPPSATKEEFVNNINYVKDYLKIVAESPSSKSDRSCGMGQVVACLWNEVCEHSFIKHVSCLFSIKKSFCGFLLKLASC